MGVQLWSSRHLHTELVALSLFERTNMHPAVAAVLPSRVRVVAQRVADLVEGIARDRAATAKAAGVVLRLDLDELVRCAEIELDWGRR